MNTRDPFNLRKKRDQPFSTLRSQTSYAFHQTTSVVSAVAESVTSASASHSSNSDPMSFAVPRNVPSFNDPQRQHEDAAWGSSGRSRFTTATTSNGGVASAVADTIGGVFSDRKNSLPMYKDKPYHHQYGSGRKGPWWKRKRSLGVGAVIFIMLFWWMGWLGGGNSNPSKKTGDSGWGSWGSSSKIVDWDERREKVRDAFKLSWKAYEEHAWGYDEFHPVQKTGRQMAGNGLGWIIVDALDSLIMMNLTKELTHAREWISTTLDYDIDHDVNTFETTIRMLGGLLSAHYLATKYPDLAPLQLGDGQGEDDLYLEKAADLADRLLGAYESPSGIPYASVNLHTMQGIKSHTDGGSSSTAEATTLQLEMKYLAQLTGETSYWEKAEGVMKAVDDIGAKDGLLPIYINADRGSFWGNNIRLGSRGDSYYEYLIKQYYQTSKQEPIYLDMWEEALRGVRKHLITYTSPSNLTIIAEREYGLERDLTPKMDHLVCFMPGTIALGATGGLSVSEAKKSGWTQTQEDDMELASQLTKTCWGMYKHTKTGLAPEIAYFKVYDPPHMMQDSVLESPKELDSAEDADWRLDYDIHANDRHNLQRPETIESLFYMWRITGDIKYREWGWEMFESFVEHTMVQDKSAFSSINDVTRVPPPIRDNMESFWLAETLKYFYLLFSPNDFIPLDQVVFNTEAHPFPRFELGKLFKTGWTRKPRDKDGNVPHDPVVQTHDHEDSETHVKVQKVLSEHQISGDGSSKSDGEKKEAPLDPVTGEVKVDAMKKE